MRQVTPKSVALFTVASLAMAMAMAMLMLMLMQAYGGSSDAHAHAAATPDPIEGFWQSSVALRDCNTSAPLGDFRGLSTSNSGGTASAYNNQPAATKGAAMGTWKKAANGSYTVTLRFWRYDADGTPAGQQRLVRTVTLAADGQSLTSTITTQALDNADAVVFSACGAETGARIG